MFRFCQLILIAAASLLLALPSQAAGLIKPVNSSYADLQIRQHHVEVVIEDGYATTQVEQVFYNPNAGELEAIYSFPVPDKAVVGEFSYWIDGQPVTGEVLEKQQARQVYEQEKLAGRETALVEKDAYKTFEINVYPVRPQQEVRVRLVYLQTAEVDHGVGRYLYPLEEGGVDEQKLAFWSRNETVEAQFSFNLKLRTSYPIDGLRLPQHPDARVQQLDAQQWQVSLASAPAVEEGAATSSGPAATLDQDILVYWRHQQGLPGRLELVAQRDAGSEPGTFMLTLTPGDDLPALQGGRDWVFVLDRSGSMRGKFATLAEGVRQGLGKLRPDDRYRIMLFNDSADEFTRGFQPATSDHIERTLNRLGQLQAGGSTNLYAGLELGLDSLDSDRPGAIVLVTDGVANVGNTERRDFLDLLQRKDVRLFTFIMGNSANRPLLEGMTRVSNGFAMTVSNADDIVGKLMQATSKLNHAALRDIELRIDGGRVSEVTRNQLGSLYRGQQLITLGRYQQPGPVTVTLTGKVGDQPRSYQTTIELPAQANLHPELERLWAFATIDNLRAEQDYLGADADARQAMKDLALQYDLVTDQTSMVVLRDEVFAAMNIDRDNRTRVANEQQARVQRAQLPVQQRQADQQQPMFSGNSASLGGGNGNGGGNGSGAVSPWLLLVVLIALGAPLQSRLFNRSTC
ncbi:VIT and vWA domain-containing protein [Marinobacterium arenosum]|uniref:VIT and vWA domain-containing protein n=1 Tax=Marinobacterium arenosum TaxID=2862496 RepID=UPI001C9437AE|nr:VIT and VWA domain-containing protein [Marinobacterium arenosum]MBY4677420.1 VIT and VWA domain-containing protein [Marinobacterium arenosum]